MSFPAAVGKFALHGRYCTTTTPVSASDVAEVVGYRDGDPKKMVWILSGTHGAPNGDLLRERDFFYEDKTLETQTFKSVDVWGAPRTMAASCATAGSNTPARPTAC